MKDGNKKMLILASVDGTLLQLINLCISELTSISLHLFYAEWQYRQFLWLKKNLTLEVLLQVLDFGKNHLCNFQEEPQAKYWSHEQLTIHPVINYYRNEDGDIVTEEITFLCDDLKHDSAAVKKFEECLDEHFKSRNLTFKHCVQFTDQCPSQYKSKSAFKDISFIKNKTRVFYGSRHGKNPSDGVTGRLKKAIKDAVLSGYYILGTPQEVFTFCKSQLETKPPLQDKEKLFQQYFYFIPKGEIKRDRVSDVYTVPGTR